MLYLNALLLLLLVYSGLVTVLLKKERAKPPTVITKTVETVRAVKVLVPTEVYNQLSRPAGFAQDSKKTAN